MFKFANENGVFIGYYNEIYKFNVDNYKEIENELGFSLLEEKKYESKVLVIDGKRVLHYKVYDMHFLNKNKIKEMLKNSQCIQ